MRWLLCLMMLVSIGVHADTHSDAHYRGRGFGDDELIGCLQEEDLDADDWDVYRGMLCLLPNQRVMVYALGMAAFGGYELVEDKMHIQMDKPPVFVTLSRHDASHQGVKVRFEGQGEFLLQINNEHPVYIDKEDERDVCLSSKVETLTFYANMNEKDEIQGDYQQGYVWQHTLPAGHNEVIISHDTQRDRFSHEMNYRLIKEDGKIYAHDIRGASDERERYYLSQNDKLLEFIHEHFDAQGNPILEKVDNPNFILVNGFHELDVFMSDSKSHGFDPKKFDYHEQGDYYTVKAEHVFGLDGENEQIKDKIYKYRLITKQPIKKTTRIDFNEYKNLDQNLSQELPSCQTDAPKTQVTTMCDGASEDINQTFGHIHE